MVVEAMKMEHRITAHGAATVREVRFGVGDRVDAGDLLVVLDRASLRRPHAALISAARRSLSGAARRRDGRGGG